MNEQIRELANHCFDVMPEDAQLHEFTNLIVRACIDQGTSVQVQRVSNGSDDYNLGREMGIEVAMNKIKQYFGVK